LPEIKSFLLWTKTRRTGKSAAENFNGAKKYLLMKSVINLKQHKLNRQKLFLFLSIVSLLFFSSCRTADDVVSGENTESEEAQRPDQATAPFEVSSFDINLAKPLQISDKPEDAALCAQINQTIEKSEYAGARWGVFVLSLKDGRIACARDGRQLFNPASVQKVLTSIVALDKLGADYRFKTSVFAPAQIDVDGTLNGDLTIYGTGAPDFDTEAMDNLVNQLQAKGLKRVRGKHRRRRQLF
jgi:D-alanyl-D-alanine carboxypeptidase